MHVCLKARASRILADRSGSKMTSPGMPRLHIVASHLTSHPLGVQGKNFSHLSNLFWLRLLQRCNPEEHSLEEARFQLS
jgi:hypothetical protein